MNDKRMEKVLQALSGRERAILFLREYKDGTNSEPNTSFLSERERREYAGLFHIIRLCNNEFAEVILLADEQVKQEELRFNAMRLIVMAADDLWVLGKYVKECVPEPVTQAEAKARKKEPRCGFHVYDDEWADDVASLQEDRKLVQGLTGRGYRLKLPFDVSGEISADPRNGIETVRLIAVIVRDSLASCWTQLKAIDLVVAEYAEEFHGEDPLRPQIREHLDDALRRIEVTKDELLEYIGEWELPDVPGEALTATRRLAQRVLR